MCSERHFPCISHSQHCTATASPQRIITVLSFASCGGGWKLVPHQGGTCATSPQMLQAATGKHKPHLGSFRCIIWMIAHQVEGEKPKSFILWRCPHRLFLRLKGQNASLQLYHLRVISFWFHREVCPTLTFFTLATSISCLVWHATHCGKQEKSVSHFWTSTDT